MAQISTNRNQKPCTTDSTAFSVTLKAKFNYKNYSVVYTGK